MEFLLFAEERSWMRVFFFLLCRPGGHRMSEESSFKRKLKVLVPFLSNQNIGWQTRLPPTPFLSSQSSDQDFQIAILLRIVERLKNYAFGNIMTPPPPKARGEKF